MEPKGLIKSPGQPDQDPKSGVRSNKKSNGFFTYLRNHPVFTTIAVFLIIILVLFLWMDISSRRQNNRIVKTATAQIEQMNQDMLILVSRPLVWSIRAEMLRGNFEEISLLISDMVRERNFRNIFVANAEGEIIVSTNKMQEGQQSSQHVPREMVAPENTTVITNDNNMLVLAAPVLGFDRRLGTLVIEYHPENVSFAVP
jgi:hypothetical protein